MATDAPTHPEFESDDLGPLVERLAEADGPADAAGTWPGTLWEALVGAGAHRWAWPDRLDRPTLAHRYARVAQGSLTAAFILTQHDAAVRRLAAVDRPLAREWLGRVAEGRAFATVGISQLTTSRRLGAQAMTAEEAPGGAFRLRGVMPWVTAAERADVFVTGAVLPDGRQILNLLTPDRPGVSVEPAFELAALPASRTAEVRCDDVLVSADEVLYGPADDVIALPGLAGTGGLETSALALGQAYAATRALAGLGEARADLGEPAGALAREWSARWSDLLGSAAGGPVALSPAQVRAAANAFVLRATQAYLTARRGSGFLLSEPAQRWARQALFFLVWSCPTPVAQAALRDFAGLCSP